MKRRILIFPLLVILLLVVPLHVGICTVSLFSQDTGSLTPGNSASANSEALADDVVNPPKRVDLELTDQSWFTDKVATALVRFPEMVMQPDGLPDVGDEISLYSLEVSTEDAGGQGGSIAVVRFVPLRSGLIVFPTLDFRSESDRFRSPATQILVSEPQRSPKINFELRPERKTVYVGQPLRVDVTWECQLTTNRIRSLNCFPEFFSSSAIETVVPRCTAPETKQMGMPFGGRRVIAQRHPPAEFPNQFGRVTFPLYLRFAEAGTVTLPATRLEIGYLKNNGSDFSPYAAYFNNGLFEPMSSLSAYDRLYTESAPLTLEVLPLPTRDRSENFSGLFAPCQIEVSINTNEIEVGQVLDVDLRVRSDAPHGMLELPTLDRQRSLRGRYRAASELSQKWYPDGTGFRARVRPLTTEMTAFPSLQFQLFDETLGTYRFLQTTPIPLKIRQLEGRKFFDFRSMQMEVTLTDQPAGIWHNETPNWMSDIFNTIVGQLAEHFWALLLAGPICFTLLLPWVRERRRRAVDVVYRRQARAYRELRKIPEGTLKKWGAFQRFLATGFSIPPEAWTTGDAEQYLHSLDLPEQDLHQILDSHAASDAREFSSERPTSTVPDLNPIAKRLFDRFRSAVVLSCVTLLLPLAHMRASDWSDAESLFEVAIRSPSGLPETESLFRQAALKFESSAEQRTRIGESWYNAGNAWFQSGELGRAISCYRQAEIYRPFDAAIQENLATARALAFDVVEGQGSFRIAALPLRWICAAIIVMSLLFWAMLLVHIRYRSKTSLTVLIASLVVTLTIISGGLAAWHHAGQQGVVIVSEIYGRKGPAYSYNTAFHEPLHDGLEFTIVDRRSDWLLVELADRRRCWVPLSETRTIRNPRR